MEKYVKVRVATILGVNSNEITLIKRLEEGFSNITYLVAYNGDKYTFRITELFINDLANEKSFLLSNEAKSITGELIYFDEIKGEKLSRYIEGSTIGYNEALDDVAQLLHRIHNIDININCFNLDLKYYEDLIDFEYPLKYQIMKEKYLQMREEIEIVQNTVCHNDFNPSNIIRGDNLYLIDFELVAMNDFYYDIASYGSFKNFKESLALLDCYLGRKANQKEIFKLYTIRIFQALKWYNVAIYKSIHLHDVHVDFNALASSMLEVADNLIKESIKI